MIIRAIEFAFLFVGLPTAYWLRWIALPMIPFLILVTLVCVAILLRDKTFDRASLWNAGAVRAGLPRVIALFCVAACGIGALVAVLAPDTLFALVKRSPLLWAMIMVLYPLFSVYPQELVYRAFFAHRYSALFSNTMVRILASSLAFGYMHIVFRNEIAVVMTL
ncbi:MAG TPA: CPBP family intramembrane metalloprotease, partial [Candidatus Hydrogenedentes bacterium]|nr:CPBP family intramembrane metalloprotease [Candidatus Hydrogenedentota bacterium]